MSWSRTAGVAMVLLLILMGIGQTQPREVTLRLPSHEQSRAGEYEDAGARVEALLSGWLGELPARAVTLEAVPWWIPPTAQQSIIQVPVRAIQLRGDRSLQRAIIAGLAHRYWFDATRFVAEDQWLAGALVRYTAVRIAGRMLESDHYMTPAFFGGALAVPVRHAPLTSDPWEGRPAAVTFDEVDALLGDGTRPAKSVRATRALQTLERFLGSPMLDVAIRAFALESRSQTEAVNVSMFTNTVERVAGTDLSWFFDSAFDETARYDYGVDAIASAPGPDGRYTSRVVVRRFGDATFTGTTRVPVGPFEEGRAIELLVRFADGSRVTEHWDGRSDQKSFEYSSDAALVEATVDPRAVLLLDEHWDNNRRSLAASSRAPARQWALLWMAWLQQAMLMTTAFV